MLFYWVVERLADHVTDDVLVQHLREISAYNVGALDLMNEQLVPSQRRELRELLARMLDIARTELPESDVKHRVVLEMCRLAEQGAAQSSSQ